MSVNDPLPPVDIVGMAVDWLAQLRAVHRPHGVPLTPSQRAALRHHFDADLLDGVRVVMMESLSRLDDTRLRTHFPSGELPIDLQAITGLTVGDTVCIGRDRLPCGAPLLPVLFQELVHVVQFQRLGLRGFVEHYLAGWARTGRTHDGIPLERQALALRRRFEGAPSRGFRVDQEIEHHVH